MSLVRYSSKKKYIIVAQELLHIIVMPCVHPGRDRETEREKERERKRERKRERGRERDPNLHICTTLLSRPLDSGQTFVVFIYWKPLHRTSCSTLQRP